jgi:hypothetical protein
MNMMHTIRLAAMSVSVLAVTVGTTLIICASEVLAAGV